MELPAPLGKYELLERLAAGGMAELYLARSRGPAGVHKTVVVKRIRPEHADDPRFVQLFINEARIGVHLHHPNIAQVYELSRAGGAWFIAMEYVHGRDLTRVVRRLRADGLALPAPIAVHIVAELARGLHHAHTRTDEQGASLGLVHHDVSPHNVLVGFDGEVKLVDFGIARTAVVDAAAPGPGLGRGKTAYASPELLQGRAVDHRADLYGAGVVLYELLAGARPFAHLSPAARARELAEAGLPPLVAGERGVDEALAAIVARAAAIDPSDRYASAALLEEDLRAWGFEQDARVTADDVARWMTALFPDTSVRVGGVRVAELARDLARLDTDAPEPTPSRVLPGRLQQSPGERKQVAVLVVDIDGLTELSAVLEPEQLFRRHFRLLRWARRIVGAWGGVLQRAIDDHLFILFGVPATREDDLSRAMDCALELQRRRGELIGRGLSLEFCIGLHAGEVSVAMTRGRVQYLARGNTTRLARRLSAVADHGQILVSERVLRQMQADFRLAAGSPVPARGGRAPEPSYLLQGRREGRAVTRAGPWLRRGEEVDRLRAVMERLGEGRGATVAVVGPVGAGKSRLALELRHLAERRRIPFHLVGRAGAASEHPLRALVLDVFGINRDASPAQVQAGLARAQELGLAPREVEILGWIAGLPRGEAPDEGDWLSAVERLLCALCEGGAAIVAFEAEGLPSRGLRPLVALLRRLVDRPLLALVLARPPLDPRLAEFAEQIVLRPFGRDVQERMVCAMLDVDEVEPLLLDRIDATSEGNPLYLQEIVAHLVAQGRLQVGGRRATLVGGAGLQLPDTVHGLIAARIDALDAASKGVLQLASVIGPHFPGALVAHAAGLDDPSPLLLELEAAGLLARRDEGWGFATELVREAASRGILGVQRRDYHRLVSEAIEVLYADRLEPWLEALAEHCARGHRWTDAARYARRHGARLQQTGRLEEARCSYERGLRWLGSAQDKRDYDARLQGEAALNLAAGTVALLLGDAQAGTRSITLALDIASEAAMPWIEVRAHLELGRRHLADGRYALAEAHLEVAREQALSEADPAVEADVLEALATLALERGRSDEAEALWYEVLERARGDAALSARCRSGLATRWLRAGELDRAEQMLRSALDAARAARDPIIEGKVLNNMGLAHSMRAAYDDALGCYREALLIREGIGYSRGLVINHHNIGDVHFQRQDYARAYVAFSRSRELAAAAGFVRGELLNDAFLCYLDARRGRATVEDLVAIEARSDALGDPAIRATACWLLGRLHAEQERPEAARESLTQALAICGAAGLVPLHALVEASLADL